MLASEIGRALDELPEDLPLGGGAFDVEELSYKEIADDHGLS